mmetsp:Transcript_1373/g.3296  ORF Transcript_1373/g.3296 Transcript_1373/m.3296 type:complete len:121 (-) Transcript_1373:4122-4484(-)
MATPSRPPPPTPPLLATPAAAVLAASASSGTAATAAPAPAFPSTQPEPRITPGRACRTSSQHYCFLDTRRPAAHGIDLTKGQCVPHSHRQPLTQPAQTAATAAAAAATTEAGLPPRCVCR